jgi:glyoxylase I family protein
VASGSSFRAIIPFMEADIDHIVLWCEDPLRSVAFYRDVVGFEPLRLAEYEAKAAPFPSVRLSPRAVIDLMARRMAPRINEMARGIGVTGDAAGHPHNHVCLAMSREDYEALRARLTAAGVDTSFGLKEAFGARGGAASTFYFSDPDGNILEARYYGPEQPAG